MSRRSAIICVAQYTKTPTDGKRFRELFIDPALKRGFEDIRIDLDGVYGYPPSFLVGAFGGLDPRNFSFTCSDQPGLVDRIRRIMRDTK